MKYFLIFAITIYNIHTIFAKNHNADTTQAVPLIAYWSLGDTINFTIEKTKKDSTANKPAVTKKSITKSSIVVLDSTDTNYTMEYHRHIDLTQLDNMIDQVPKNVQHKIKEFSDIKILYETKETGEFIGVLNQDEIYTKFISFVNILTNELTQTFDKEMDKQKFTEVFQNFMSKISKEQLMNMYSEDVQLLHFALGYEWSTKDTTFYEEDIDVPIYDFTVNSDCAWYCSDFQPDSGYVSFTEEKSINSDMFKYGYSRFIKEMTQLMGQTEATNKFPENMDMSIYMKNLFTYDIAYAYPIAVTNYKEVEVKDNDDSHVSIEVQSIYLDDIRAKQQ